MKILIIIGKEGGYFRGSVRTGAKEFSRRLVHIGWQTELVELADFLNKVPDRLLYDDLAVVGGDGTINAVLPHINDWPLLIVPAGTGNDLARSLSIFSISDSTRHLQHNRKARIDAGRVRLDDDSEWRLFSNGVGIGFDGVVASWHARGRSYWMGVVANLINPPMFRASMVIDDGEPRDLQFMSFVCANGSYFGGGFKLAPMARLNDGLLDLVIIKPASRWEYLSSLRKARKGRHLGHSAVEWVRCRKFSLVAEEHLPLHIDGEIGKAKKISADILSEKFSVYGVIQ